MEKENIKAKQISRLLAVLTSGVGVAFFSCLFSLSIASKLIATSSKLIEM